MSVLRNKGQKAGPSPELEPHYHPWPVPNYADTAKTTSRNPAFSDPHRAWIIRHEIVLWEYLRDVDDEEKYEPRFVDGRWSFGPSHD